MSTAITDIWIPLSSFPQEPYSYCSSELTGINNEEFVKFSRDSCQKYNISEDKWDELALPIPKDISLQDVTCAFDKKTENLFISTQTNMVEINLKTNDTKATRNVTHIGYGGRGLILNDQFHAIAGMRNNQHLIWNGNNFEPQFNLAINHPGIAHISSKKSVLCMGGYEARVKDSIYLFNTVTKTWTELSQKLPDPLFLFGCVVTKNEKYVILLGGYASNGMIDTIYILNVKTLKFAKSKVVCPLKSTFQAVNVYNTEKEKLLTFGYVRDLWKNLEFNTMLFPPFYLINIMSMYYSNEWIFLMEKEGKELWKIKMDSLFNSDNRQ